MDGFEPYIPTVVTVKRIIRTIKNDAKFGAKMRKVAN